MRYYISWKNYWLLQERQPEIGGALFCQRMLAFLSNIMVNKDDRIVMFIEQWP